jgi:tetratricopeptide (TPR) repeat protein
MPARPNKISQFWQELKRRNVPRSLAIYAGTAFIVLEASDIIFPRWGLPDWTVDLVLYILIVGAVITAIVSWIYDMTPQGITKTGSLETSHSDGSLSAEKPSKTSTIIIAMLIVVIGILVYPKIFRNSNLPLSGKMQSSIAVLPLKIIGEDAELGFFASGLVESLTHMLSKVGNSKQAFTVIPSSEILEAITAGEARKKFGVSLVISGSIQKDQKSSRVILNLIDAKKQYLIRSEKLDYPADEDLIIQDEIIAVMVSMLGMDLEEGAREQLALGGSSLNVANELYLIGRGIFREGVESVEDIDKALEYFLGSLEQDSVFAKAYAGIAQAYTLKYHRTLDPSWNEESLKYSLRAVELNDQDPYALMSLAASLVEKGEYEEALKYYEKSRDLDSSRAMIFSEMAYLYELDGQYDQAEQCHLKAIELDPESHLTHYYLGAFYHAVARYDEATVEIKKALEFSPGHLTIMHALGGIYWAAENFSDAKSIFEEIIEIDSAQGRVYWNLGTIAYYQGDFAKSIQYFKEAEKYTPMSHGLYWSLGRSYYWSGEKSMAGEVISKAVSIAKGTTPIPLLNIASYYGLMGSQDSAEYYMEASGLADHPGDMDATQAFLTGEFYLYLGKEAKAFEWIESGLSRGHGWLDLRHSSLYNNLAQNKEFQEMIARSKEASN